jgi:hypothetical protein
MGKDKEINNGFVCDMLSCIPTRGGQEALDDASHPLDADAPHQVSCQLSAKGHQEIRGALRIDNT